MTRTGQLVRGGSILDKVYISRVMPFEAHCAQFFLYSTLLSQGILILMMAAGSQHELEVN
jgi:hypothetical protein